VKENDMKIALGANHDDMNVLAMGGRVIGESVALELVCAFVNSKYTGEDRHQRRLEKVKAIEERYAAQGRSK
jgi:ribose 5-phosphate isomerase B